MLWLLHYLASNTAPASCRFIVRNGDYKMTNKQLLNDAIALALMAVAFILCLFI